MSDNVTTIRPAHSGGIPPDRIPHPISATLPESHRQALLLQRLAAHIEEPAASVYAVLGHIMKAALEPTDVNLQFPIRNQIGHPYLLGKLHTQAGLCGIVFKVERTDTLRHPPAEQKINQRVKLDAFKRQLGTAGGTQREQTRDYLNLALEALHSRCLIPVGIVLLDDNGVLLSYDKPAYGAVFRIDMTYRYHDPSK